jgi:outer membrane biosynthesis protein TonB
MTSDPSIDIGDIEEPSSLRDVGRSALWAGFALAALIGAILTARSEVGVHRINEALNILREPPEAAHAPVPQLAYDPTAEREARRLSERVHTLAADRDRLIARLDALERAVEVTGSVPKVTSPQPEASPITPPMPEPRPAPPMAAAAPSVTTIPPQPAQPMPAGTTEEELEPASPPGSSAPTPMASAAPEAAAQSTATQTEFGIDLGAAHDVAHLRALWSIVLAQHGQLLEGLRPVVAVQPGRRHGTKEMRLVAGPLLNAASATRLCAVLAGVGRTCTPSVFDPQKQALR